MPRRKENYEIAQDKDNFYYARSGAVIVRKRERSKVWQCTFKIDNQWVRRSTNERDLDKAIDSACESYDRLRFLQEADITVVSKRFKSVANATLKKLQAQIDSGLGKVIYKDYVAVINNYLIPFFGMYQVHTIDITALQQFNSWRKEKLGRMPAKSTISTHNSALNAVMEMGIERGMIKTNPIPKLKNVGRKGQARNWFNLQEYGYLWRYMVHWSKKGESKKSMWMRELLRDYVLILANTGMRSGTEALNLKWNNISINKEQDIKFSLQKGKNGARELYARENVRIYLERIANRDENIANLTLEQIIKKRYNEYVFRLRDGTRTNNLNQTFAQLMDATGLNDGLEGAQKRTLYSLRHTYATFSLLYNDVSYDVLRKQMGTSIGMLVKHYDKVTIDMVSGKLSGRLNRQRKDLAVSKEVRAEEKKISRFNKDNVIDMWENVKVAK